MKRLVTVAVMFLLVPVGFLGHTVWQDLHGAAEPLGQSVEETGKDSNHLSEAQSAYDRGNHLLVQAIQAGSKAQLTLLARAAVQFRVCLAYEGDTSDAGNLFADARKGLERSQLLLTQARIAQQSAGSQVAAAKKNAEEPKVAPAPVAPPSPKPATKSPVQVAEKSAPPPKQTDVESKPARTAPVVNKPKKIAVGPDGVIYEIVSNGDADSER